MTPLMSNCLHPVVQLYSPMKFDVCCIAAGAPSASSPAVASLATALASAAQSNVNAAAQVIAQASARMSLSATWMRMH